MRRDNGWLQTYTGKAFYFEDPQPEDIDIIDIAHALSMICRFGGHTAKFYSVAEHSIWTNHILKEAGFPKQVCFQGLLHDATEAYLGDMVKGLKLNMPDYCAVEQRVWEVIAKKFGVPVEMDPAVKQADLVMLFEERNQLLSIPPKPWKAFEHPERDSRIYFNLPLDCSCPTAAKSDFLHTCYDYISTHNQPPKLRSYNPHERE